MLRARLQPCASGFCNAALAAEGLFGDLFRPSLSLRPVLSPRTASPDANPRHLDRRNPCICLRTCRCPFLNPCLPRKSVVALQFLDCPTLCAAKASYRTENSTFSLVKRRGQSPTAAFPPQLTHPQAFSVPPISPGSWRASFTRSDKIEPAKRKRKAQLKKSWA